jgi:hypothetical protein
MSAFLKSLASLSFALVQPVIKHWRFAMQVLFQSRDPEGMLLRKLAVERVRFAMRRLTWLVPRAKISLTDINGPHGGMDKRCQLELKTDANGTVVVTSIARDWSDALNTALARAARTIVREWRRSRSTRPVTRRRARGMSLDTTG